MNRRPRCIAALLVAAALCLLALPARAQRIVLLRPTTADPALLQAFGRLKGELMSYDFEVVVLDAADAEPSPRALARVAEHERAVATVSLVRSEGLATADVWISDRVTGKTTMRTIATSDGGEASSVLAVRAVDLLRASLREFPTGVAPPRDIVGAAPERAPLHVREWAREREPRRRWAVEAGVVLQSTLSRLGSVYGPAISLGYMPSERTVVALGFQGPLSGARASSGGASLSLQSEQLFAEARYRPLTLGRWSADVTFAIGAHRFAVDGQARLPYVGRSDSAWTALAALGLAVEWRVAHGVAVDVAARAVVLAPKPVARLADTELSYGRPSLQACANLRVDF